MRYALSLIKNHEKYVQRFEAYVAPMVYNEQLHDFETCFTSFEKVSTEILDKSSFNE
ncbi:conserved hypothetical protein [Photorhabdus asymbiotica]|uniref:Uncharacterized protein n=1 Tax=Photorhabdus asymbiotica subsp. asymbiotica (strain ATCC 43949 / 3105-77) TaxID=553480 RepID=B6VN02_PHOAA|nr:conserved hypothetical protein [Photorhabdus asymbiotica]CAR67532.1 Hypothetical Protein PA-RVA15-17-0962 [Photorhabdus asymbiotica subsp. asymbiotica ATCC 43949]